MEAAAAAATDGQVGRGDGEEMGGGVKGGMKRGEEVGGVSVLAVPRVVGNSRSAGAATIKMS